MGITNQQNNDELNIKINRIQRLLDQHGLDALVLRRVSSFAWATCGAASYINTAVSEGAASLLITADKRYLVTNNIEAPHFEKEEKLLDSGWELCISPWYADADYLATLSSGMKLGADGFFPGVVDLSSELAFLRSQLTSEEILRFRSLGVLCAEAMKEAFDGLRPGMTEYQAAGLLSEAVESRGVQAIVNLVAFDERIFAFRHPLPTDKILRNYAMLVLCGRKWGLVCSLTRLVHFGKLPADLRRKMEAVARVDATMIAATRPGTTMGEVFRRAQEAYQESGFPDEWQLHHQGGLAGYEPREIVAIPDLPQKISVDQTFAWNPSITGVKSEDTILIGERSNEILTKIEGWPVIEINMDGQRILRPVIQEKD